MKAVCWSFSVRRVENILGSHRGRPSQQMCSGKLGKKLSSAWATSRSYDGWGELRGSWLTYVTSVAPVSRNQLLCSICSFEESDKNANENIIECHVHRSGKKITVTLTSHNKLADWGDIYNSGENAEHKADIMVGLGVHENIILPWTQILLCVNSEIVEVVIRMIAETEIKIRPTTTYSMHRLVRDHSCDRTTGRDVLLVVWHADRDADTGRQSNLQGYRYSYVCVI